jgi:hypothetical protein
MGILIQRDSECSQPVHASLLHDHVQRFRGTRLPGLALIIQCDYINPIDLCNKLNVYIIPEMVYFSHRERV